MLTCSHAHSPAHLLTCLHADPPLSLQHFRVQRAAISLRYEVGFERYPTEARADAMATVTMLEDCIHDVANNPFVASVNDPTGDSKMVTSSESP